MLEILREMAHHYQKKKPGWIVGKIQIKIDEKMFLVQLEESTIEVDGSDNQNTFDIGLVMSEETFGKLASGEWNGMTAAGRESMSQSAPLDFELPEGKKLEGDTLQMLYHFLTHFFSSEYPTVTKLGREHSRKVHGGSAVPIAYGPGVRYAYYTIKKGEQINEEESDPWDQVFTVISGTGTAIIDDKNIELKKNTAVHVPPLTKHIIKKDKGDDELELMWLAYGEKA